MDRLGYPGAKGLGFRLFCQNGIQKGKGLDLRAEPV